MTDLTFDISWERSESADPLEAATFAGLEMRVGGQPITAVVDELARTTRDRIRVPLYPLATWFAANWWRLRFEGERSGPEWEMSHCLAAAGGGSAWPDVAFVSDGESIEVRARRAAADPVSPVRYLNEARVTVPGDRFERGVDAFVDTVVARLEATGHGDSELSALWRGVRQDRARPAVATWRRFEALLGRDPDEADPAVIDEYLDGARRFGEAAVAELAAAAPNDLSPRWLRVTTELRGAQVARVPDLVAFRDAVRDAVEPAAPAWQRGESAARAVRRRLRRPDGPLSNDTLLAWFDCGPSGLLPARRDATTLATRDGAEAECFRVLYRGRHADARRFELARMLCEHLLSARPDDTLLPGTRARTARQSVQRAFAAEFLLPWHELEAAVDASADDDALEEIARDYEVSPLLVRTRLVAKQRLSSEALDGPR